MATAQELLSSIADPEEHIVIGADRFITVPKPLQRIAVQFDHDVETVTFDCPRYWDDLDMSNMTVYINYKLPDGTLDAYPAKNIKAEIDIMHFDWTISRNLTQYKGTIAFLVCIKKTGTDGTEVNHWNSELCTDMYISEGMECEEQAQMEYSDLITQLLERMTVVEQINVQAEEMREMHDKVLSETTGIRQTSANAIKGTASGKIIHIDDVSPVEHNVNTKVYGKNLIGAFKSSKAVVRDGVTFSVEANGQTIMLNGTCGLSSGGRTLLSEASSIFTLEKGKTYTLSQELVSGTTDGTYSVYVSTVPDYAAVANVSNISGYTTKTFTPNKNMECIIGVNDTANATYENVVVRFQLEEGDTATEYEPYIDPTTVTVTWCGKNITDIPDISSNGYGFTMDDYIQWYLDLPVGTEITISADYNTTDANSATVGWNLILNNSLPTIHLWTPSPQFTNSTTKRMSHTHVKTLDISKSDIKTSVLYLGQGFTTDRTFKNVTVNIGNTDLGYEPYKGGTYTPNADGSVDIKSVSPFMQIFTDTPGIKLDCEYNRDTNIVMGDISTALDILIAMQEDTITLLDNMSGGTS